MLSFSFPVNVIQIKLNLFDGLRLSECGINIYKTHNWNMHITYAHVYTITYI